MKVYSGAGSATQRAVWMDQGKGIEPFEPAPSQAVALISREGFNWGFLGSGPHQLAIALLLDVTHDQEIARTFAMRFKYAYVATWGWKWQITEQEIKEWLIEERLK